MAEDQNYSKYTMNRTYFIAIIALFILPSSAVAVKNDGKFPFSEKKFIPQYSDMNCIPVVLTNIFMLYKDADPKSKEVYWFHNSLIFGINYINSHYGGIQEKDLPTLFKDNYISAAVISFKSVEVALYNGYYLLVIMKDGKDPAHAILGYAKTDKHIIGFDFYSKKEIELTEKDIIKIFVIKDIKISE